jgi:hypothetical protein
MKYRGKVGHDLVMRARVEGFDAGVGLHRRRVDIMKPVPLTCSWLCEPPRWMKAEALDRAVASAGPWDHAGTARRLPLAVPPSAALHAM